MYIFRRFNLLQEHPVQDLIILFTAIISQAQSCVPE